MEPKILIVDDEPAALQRLKEFLSASDFNFIETADGVETAKEKAKNSHFDVIVTDMIMGNTKKEGYELVEYFKDLSPLVIVITAHPETEHLKECMRAGAYDYIDKAEKSPFKKVAASISEGLKTLKKKNLFPDKNSIYVKDNFEELRKKYPGKYIAVFDDTVRADDRKYSRLKERVSRDFPYARVFIVNMPGEE